MIKKQDKISKELHAIHRKLDNKSFIEKAPKHIVEQDKNTYNDLKNNIDKINLTIKSLKWKLLTKKNYQAGIPR